MGLKGPRGGWRGRDIRMLGSRCLAIRLGFGLVWFGFYAVCLLFDTL